jgi:N-acetylmuramoyl-L-alanine amidase
MAFFAALLTALFGLIPGLAGAYLPAGPGGAGEVVIPLAHRGGGAGSPLPRIYGPSDASRPLVVIDPGHGGRDPGATSTHDGRPEKHVTLALAKSVRDALVASGRVRVALTREDDAYLVLRDRYEIARRMKADLFISVHADAAPNNNTARGATIYTLSEVASDREAALLAAQENKSDLIGGALAAEDAGVNRILIDLAQRESMNVSADFAQLLRRAASDYFAFQPNYHRFASLIVLKAPDVPSILFESGYLTNAEDSAYIQSEAGRARMATGIRRAIETHFARRIVRANGR